MRQSIVLRVGLAAAITLLFTMAFLGMLHAAVGCTTRHRKLRSR